MTTRRNFILGAGTSFLVPALSGKAQASAEQFLAFFTGRISGEGVIRDFKKNETRQIKASLVGRKAGESLQLTEDFTFSDGRKEHKVWTFSQRGGSIIGKRSDIRDAANVALSGDRATIAYTARTPVDGSTYNLAFTEQIEFVSAHQLESVTSIRWTLFPVGEIRLSLRKS